jgi:hypothetical protein
VINRYRGDFALKARPRGRFALATKNFTNRVLHVIDSAEAVWTRWRRGPAHFDRMTGVMSCGRRLASITLHIEPVAQFELCDYCLAAQLGIDAPGTASARVAHVSLGDLDRIERELGVPVSRTIRRVRLEVAS